MTSSKEDPSSFVIDSSMPQLAIKSKICTCLRMHALPATVLMTNAMNFNAVLDELLLRQGDIPRLLNEKIREVKNPKKDRDVTPASSVSSGNAPKTPTVSKVVPSNTSDSRRTCR